MGVFSSSSCPLFVEKENTNSPKREKLMSLDLPKSAIFLMTSSRWASMFFFFIKSGMYTSVIGQPMEPEQAELARWHNSAGIILLFWPWLGRCQYLVMQLVSCLFIAAFISTFRSFNNSPVLLKLTLAQIIIFRTLLAVHFLF